MRIVWCLWCSLLGYLPLKATGDSLHYLTPQDSLQLVVDEWQQKYVIHHLEKGQTLYSLARFYGLRLTELLTWNPEWRAEVLPQGAAIRIPLPDEALVCYRTPGFADTAHVPVFYRIRKHDTFYGLSKRLFHMDADTILARNPFLIDGLKPGQLIQIGWLSVHGIPDSLRRQRRHPLWQESYELRERFLAEAMSRPVVTQKGAAYWNRESENNRSLFALHDEAPRGSIIAVTNPMTRRQVFVRVIGKVPESPFFDNVVVVVSPAVARMLGAIDPRFFVEVEYFRSGR